MTHPTTLLHIDASVLGEANAGAEHVESYLKTVFGFIGVTDLEFIAADGIQIGPEQRAKAVSGALEAASLLRAA